jgi:hypothetical protein
VAKEAEPFDPYQLLRSLQLKRVSFVVIGAFARVIHGTGEITDTIDITPSMREDNVARLARGLAELEAHCGDGRPLDLTDTREPVIALVTRAGGLNLVREPAGTRGYDDLRRHASQEPLGQGVRPQVASPGDLARMLGAVGRDDQLEILLRLRRLIELDRTLGREHGRGPTLER